MGSTDDKKPLEIRKMVDWNSQRRGRTYGSYKYKNTVEIWGMSNHAPILLQQIKTKMLTTKQKYVII